MPRHSSALLAFVLVLAAASPAAGQGDAALPEAERRTDPLPTPVYIGLVVPADGPLAEVGASVRQGAERAVSQANERGGYRGRPFELRVVTPEGLWGQGLSRVVSLSFDAPVAAVIGGVDGRGAHLIQQVITKARIPFATPWASDYTLSRAMLPWFFQVVPDDRQQAEAIVADALREGAGIVVVADTGYDSRQVVAAVRHVAADRDVPVAVVAAEALPAAWPDGAPAADGDRAVILAVDPRRVPVLLRQLDRLDAPLRVHIPIRLVPAVRRSAGAYSGPILVPLPEGAVGGAAASSADLPAALAHDATRAVIAAIRSVGPDPWLVREALAKQAVDGALGPLRFEDTGRRAGTLRTRPIGPDRPTP